MIFYASIRRELAQSFSGVLVVLLSIVMTMMLIRTLAMAAKGSVGPQDIFLIMSYLTLSFLPIILTLSLFLSVTSCLARWYKDSEMAIWFASGQSLLGFWRPIFRFAFPVLLTIALLALFIWPWANRQIDQLREQFAQRSDLDRIAPGEFQLNKSGTRVFFTDSTSSSSSSSSTPSATSNPSQTQKGGNVFIYGQVGNKNSITTASSGKVERDKEGNASLVLHNGQIVSENTSTGTISISHFASYSTQVSNGASPLLDTSPGKNTPSHLLLHSREGRGEFSWRLGIALCAFNFLLIALLLVKNTNRSGKGSHLMLSLTSFAVYYNMVNLGQSWIANGRVALATWLLALHGGVFLACLLLLWFKQNPGFLRLPSRQASAATAV